MVVWRVILAIFLHKPVLSTGIREKQRWLSLSLVLLLILHCHRIYSFRLGVRFLLSMLVFPPTRLEDLCSPS